MQVEYFYFWGLLFVVPIFLFVFFLNDKSIRKKIIISGLGFGIFAVVIGQAYSIRDYWHPVYLFKEYHIEDFLYGFLYAGSLSAYIPLIFKTKSSGTLKLNFRLTFIYIFIVIFTFGFFIHILNLNSIYPLIVSPLLVGIVSIISFKENPLKPLLNGLIGSFTTIFIYNIILLIYPLAIENHFELEKLLGIIVFRVPIEEILFVFCLGFGSTFAYESAFNLKQVPKNVHLDTNKRSLMS